MGFYGKNEEQSSAVLAAQRSFYKTSAFTERNGLGPEQVSDFTFAEFVNYGRIDPFMDTVILKKESLSYIESGDEGVPIGLLGFVAAAAKDMIADFDRARFLAKIPVDNPLLSKIELHGGYIDPEDGYYNYISSLFEEFVSTITGSNMKEQIMNFASFVNHFFSFYKQKTPMVPLTYTSWQRSKESSIFTSGLAFSISSFPIDKDHHKTKFLLNPIFPYYKKVCLNRGFFISKNSPWVLVADLGSPQMKKYYGKEDLLNPTGVFNTHYTRPYVRDIELMKIIMIRSYNAFSERLPYEKTIHYCPNNKLKPEIKIREPISIQAVNQKFPNSFFISLYAKIRNIEEDKPYTTAALNKIINSTKKLEKRLDMDRAMDYINEEFRKTYKNKHGGVNWYSGLMKHRRQPS